MNCDGWTFTRHAVERALDMAISADELRNAMVRPDVVYPSVKYPGSVIHQKGRLALAVRDQVVITVLWTALDYDRADDIRKAQET